MCMCLARGRSGAQAQSTHPSLLPRRPERQCWYSVVSICFVRSSAPHIILCLTEGSGLLSRIVVKSVWIKILWFTVSFAADKST